MAFYQASTWRLDGLARMLRVAGGAMMPTSEQHSDTPYLWRHGRFEVLVERQGDGWHVQSSSTGRLFGPRQTLYDAKHTQARNAAWDVMACVIRASQDEEIGVNAGREAARWMSERRTAD